MATSLPRTTLSDDEILNTIEHSFRSYAFRDIVVLKDNAVPVPVAVFILCTCFIDQLAGFRYNSDRTTSRFQNFVTQYLPQYDPIQLCDDLRNRLVHNYSVGEAYVVSDSIPSMHNRPFTPGSSTKGLDMHKFIEDLEVAFNAYMGELRSNPECRNNAILWYHRYRIIVLSQTVV